LGRSHVLHHEVNELVVAVLLALDKPLKRSELRREVNNGGLEALVVFERTREVFVCFRHLLRVLALHRVKVHLEALGGGVREGGVKAGLE
jgi:hypothetical protein